MTNTIEKISNKRNKKYTDFLYFTERSYNEIFFIRSK